MVSTDRLRGGVSRAVILGWGTGSLLLTLTHMLTAEDSLRELVVGYTIPVLLSAGVIATGFWLHIRLSSDREFWRVAKWCSGGILAMLVFEASSVLYQIAEGTGVAEPRYVLLHAGTAGALSGVLLGIYDVRARRRERELRNQREWVERLSQGLVVLQRVFRHDIRSAVNVIRGHAEVLRDERRDSEELVGNIIRNTTELETLANKARRIEPVANRGDQVPQSVDLVSSLRTQVEAIESEFPSASVTIFGPDSLYVEVFPEIDFALHEVIENAVVHNDTDAPEITIRIQPAAESPRGCVKVRVLDDGPGIPRDELEVFEKAEETQLLHSSGIGLWVVKWLIEESNGSVAFRRRDDGGTLVTIGLPAATDRTESIESATCDDPV